jgi:hypothetical protein
MADLLAYLLQKTYLGLQSRPWSEAEMALVNEPLPNPMIPGNFELTSNRCHVSERLVHIVEDQLVQPQILPSFPF